jgi:hypothetical protein
MAGLNFKDVAKMYRLIDADTINILVSYDEAEFSRLREGIYEILDRSPRKPGELRKWIAAARRMSVGHLYKGGADAPIFQHLDPVHFGRPRPDGRGDWYLPLHGLKYDEDLGLLEENEWQTVI